MGHIPPKYPLFGPYMGHIWGLGGGLYLKCTQIGPLWETPKIPHFDPFWGYLGVQKGVQFVCISLLEGSGTPKKGSKWGQNGVFWGIWPYMGSGRPF